MYSYDYNVKLNDPILTNMSVQPTERRPAQPSHESPTHRKDHTNSDSSSFMQTITNQIAKFKTKTSGYGMNVLNSLYNRTGLSVPQLTVAFSVMIALSYVLLRLYKAYSPGRGRRQRTRRCCNGNSRG